MSGAEGIAAIAGVLGLAEGGSLDAEGGAPLAQEEAFAPLLAGAQASLDEEASATGIAAEHDEARFADGRAERESEAPPVYVVDPAALPFPLVVLSGPHLSESVAPPPAPVGEPVEASPRAPASSRGSAPSPDRLREGPEGDGGDASQALRPAIEPTDRDRVAADARTAVDPEEVPAETVAAESAAAPTPRAPMRRRSTDGAATDAAPSGVPRPELPVRAEAPRADRAPPRLDVARPDRAAIAPASAAPVAAPAPAPTHVSPAPAPEVRRADAGAARARVAVPARTVTTTTALVEPPVWAPLERRAAAGPSLAAIEDAVDRGGRVRGLHLGERPDVASGGEAFGQTHAAPVFELVAAAAGLPGVKETTVATVPTPDAAARDAAARIAAPEPREDAVRLAETVGHARVLRDLGAAHGQIVVPELGRVEVRARLEASKVDVRVRADEDHARHVIASNVAELRAHVQVEVPNATVNVERSAADPPDAGTSSRDRGEHREAFAGERREDGRGASEAAPMTRAPRGPRVRIVL